MSQVSRARFPLRPLAGLALFALTAVACSAEPPGSAAGPPAAAAPGIRLRPPLASPGQAVRIEATIPGVVRAAVVSLAGVSVPMALLALADGVEATAEVVSPSAPGDAPVTITATLDDGGTYTVHALLHVTAGALCPEGQDRIGGVCRAPSSGHGLRIDRLMPWTYADEAGVDGADPATPMRTMTHPRAAVWWEDSVLICASDAFGIMRLDDMLPTERFSAEWPGRPRVAEVRMADTGLSVCQGVALDDLTGVAVVTSRGDTAGPGGLATFRIQAPRPGRAVQPPTLAEARPDADGYEEVVARGGRALATRKPNRIDTFALDTEGGLEPRAELVIPEVSAAWSLAFDGDRLLVTDAGAPRPAGASGPEGAQLLVLDAADPEALRVLGALPVGAPARGLALLGDGRVAVGIGPDGLAVVDVSDPAHPVLEARAHTPGSVTGLAAAGGLLFAADWDTLRLYDVAERGVVRLLDASDGLEADPGPLPPAFMGAPWVADIFSGYFVTTLQDRFLVADIEVLYLGTVDPAAAAPRLNVLDRKLAVRPGTSEDRVIRVANGGRETVRVRVLSGSEIPASAVVPPGEGASLEVRIPPHTAAGELVLESNDPARSRRVIQIMPVSGGLGPGDLFPPMALPALVGCSGPGCPAAGACVPLGPPGEGRPVVIGFFSSW